MRNSIQQGSREFTAVIKAGSIGPEDFARWEMARLISNRSSAKWRSTIIKVGPSWSGSVVSKMQKTEQRKELCLSGTISSVSQKKHLMILPVPAVTKN